MKPRAKQRELAPAGAPDTNYHVHHCQNCGREWEHHNRSRLGCNGGEKICECWPCWHARHYGKSFLRIDK